MTAATVRRAGWHHPEAPAALVAGLAWVLLVAQAMTHEGAHATHAHQPTPAWAGGAAGWIVMTVAMMVPATLPDVRRIALDALWHRRQRTVALFLSSYVCVWGAYGAVAGLTLHTLRGTTGVGTGALLAVALAAAALWELMPQKRRALRACHVIAPLPPRGAKADAGCAAAGVRYGLRCVTSCWALMAPLLVAGHPSVALMAPVTLVVVSQKVMVRGTRTCRPTAAALAGVALALAAVP